MLYNGFVFQSGDKITCYISNSFIEGTIHIYDERMWICHDEPKFDGDRSDVLYGHNFSWTFHKISHNRLSDDVTHLMPLLQYVKSKDVTIDARLNKIFSAIMDRNTVTRTFYFKLKPFEDFCNIEYSDNPGFIILNGTVKTKNGSFKKKVEIKLSRYLKKISDSYCALLKEQNFEPVIIFNDSQIEKIYNSFVAFQSGEYFKLEILRGDEIDKGYIKDNYSSVVTGTIHNSCMSDRIHYLDLYKKNDNVALAVLKSPNGIEARCLLWTLENGQTYYDRIYFSFEWIYNVMIEKLKKMSYLSLIDENTGDKINARIKIENADFQYYPYLDSFSIYSPETKYLYCYDMSKLPKGRYRKYQRTDGSFSNFSV